MYAPAIALDDRSRPQTHSDAIARAVLAGFVASLTMLLMFLVAYNLARLVSLAPILATPSGEPLRLWLANLTHNRLIDAGLNEVYLAAGIYVAGGLIWAVLYTLVEPHLVGSPMTRGVTFAVIPAMVSLVVVLPLLGGGLFGIALGAGPLPIIGNLLLHAVYGAILGIVYGPMGDLDASTLERPLPTHDGARSSGYERTAAILLVGGLVVGGIAGLVISTAAGGEAAPAIAGASSGGLILSAALLGAAIGVFVGTFLGLAERAH